MKLKEFYSLRKDFTIIGLTGRSGAGCSKTAQLLSDEKFIENCMFSPTSKSLIPEEIKFEICYNYLKHGDNWENFKIINYKDVLLLHIIFDSKRDNRINDIISAVFQFGDSGDFENPRFSSDADSEMISGLKVFLTTYKSVLENAIFDNSDTDFKTQIKTKDDNGKIEFIRFFFYEFKEFSDKFHSLLNRHNTFKRSLFNHDIAYNLRSCGSTRYCTSTGENNSSIYVIAETINQIIKCWKLANSNRAKIVIDSLKNSLELMYFKEKFSGFYMVAVNKDEPERHNYVKSKITKTAEAELILNLDATEYKGDEFSEGKFASPDIENCIQKSDYHIFHSEESKLDSDKMDERITNLNYQLIKLCALIAQPGLITPTAIERTMQIAYNAKFNSGCISRQVGAVITDQNFIVKSIGWNDVAKGQMPCKLRDVRDLLVDEPHEIFSDYEKEGTVIDTETKESGLFKSRVNDVVREAEITSENLQGRHCSFCFKSFQNAFERVKNQVHTRSLHAEENAMLQISKKGGNALEGGKLFTTASPCELCSKKAFQLGITEIYYIDPYPGIAMKHTLRNGIVTKESNPNPVMKMYRGAVGRAYHKLYEPFMSYKDEIGILTKLNPQAKKLSNEELIDKMDVDINIKEKMLEILESR